MDLFFKTEKGEFLPISFDKVVTKDWDKSLIVVRIGTDEFPADEKEAEETVDSLNDASVLDDLDISFLITLHNLDFEVLGSTKEIKDKCITVKVKSDDDLDKLEFLQKEAKKQLRGKTKKVVILPTPLTVEEYKEVQEIKERVEIRKRRRGL